MQAADERTRDGLEVSRNRFHAMRARVWQRKLLFSRDVSPAARVLGQALAVGASTSTGLIGPTRFLPAALGRSKLDLDHAFDELVSGGWMIAARDEWRLTLPEGWQEQLQLARPAHPISTDHEVGMT